MADSSREEDNRAWQCLREFNDFNEKPFKMAMGIAQCSNGDFVIADPVAVRVEIFTSSGTFKTDVKSLDQENGKLFQPSDVAVTSDGRIIVVDKSALVKVYDAESAYFKFGFKTVSTTVESDVRTHVCPSAVQVYKDQSSSHEYIYVLDILRKLITCHEQDGSYVKSFGAGGNANYFSVVDQNKFVMSDFNDHKVRIIDSNGYNIAIIDTPIDNRGRRASPVGSCVDRNRDRFYVAMGKRQGYCDVLSYDLNTGTFIECVATKLNNPFNMDITKDGTVVVADKRTVKVFSNTK